MARNKPAKATPQARKITGRSEYPSPLDRLGMAFSRKSVGRTGQHTISQTRRGKK